MINWKVRVKNKVFWVALIPAAILLLQSVAAVFGFTIDLSGMSNKLLAVVNSVFVVLSIVGVVADPTTDGLEDSSLALSYDAPRKE